MIKNRFDLIVNYSLIMEALFLVGIEYYHTKALFLSELIDWCYWAFIRYNVPFNILTVGYTEDPMNIQLDINEAVDILFQVANLNIEF